MLKKITVRTKSGPHPPVTLNTATITIVYLIIIWPGDPLPLHCHSYHLHHQLPQAISTAFNTSAHNLLKIPSQFT